MEVDGGGVKIEFMSNRSATKSMHSRRIEFVFKGEQEVQTDEILNKEKFK